MPSGMNNGHERLLNEALKSLDKVDEQLNLARENLSRAAYHNGKARKAIQGLGGLPSVAFSITGFLLVAFAGWSGFRAMQVPVNDSPSLKVSVPASNFGDQSASIRSTDLIGSKESGLFHLPGCVDARRIEEKNRLTFSSADQARSAGLRPCPHCGQAH